jgi:hypothetical protein
LIERVEAHPTGDGFRIELIGEIANIVRLSGGTESVASEIGRASVKVVAGTPNRNRPVMAALHEGIGSGW